MGLARLQRGVRFWYKASAWEITQSNYGRSIIARNIEFGNDTSLEWSEVLRAFSEGTLRFEVKGKAARKASDEIISFEYQYADFETLDPAFREVAWLRYQVIQPLVRIPPGTRSKRDVIHRLEEVRRTLPSEQVERLPRSYQTVYEWMRDFEESEWEVRSLIPGWKKRGRHVKSQEILETIDALIQDRWLVPERPSVQRIAELAMSQLARENRVRLKPISLPKQHALYMMVRRRIDKLNPEDVLRERYGDRAAQHEYGTIGDGPKVNRVLQIAQIDHTKLDLFVVDDDDRLPIGRPWLTLCIDVYSGAALGFDVSFEPPSTLSVMRCLRHAILPKENPRESYSEVVHEWTTFGVPESLVVDNGKEFIGKSMESACFDLGIELIQSRIRNPEFKGAIERRFGQLNKELLEGVPGCTFSNVIERGDYNPAKNAVIKLSAFMEILHLYTVDFYMQRPNSRGAIPAEIWEQGCRDYPPALTCNREELNVLLGAYEERTLGRSGIEFECLRYSSPKLSILRTRLNRGRVREPVKFKYDPGNLSRIWVRDPFEEQWVEVPCTDQEYTNRLSLWKHRVIKRYARQELERVDYVALADAKAKIQAIVDREYSTTKQVTARMKLARFRTGGVDSSRIDERSQEPRNQSESDQPDRADSQDVSPPKPKRASRKKQDTANETKPAAVQTPQWPIPDTDDDLDLSTWRALG